MGVTHDTLNPALDSRISPHISKHIRKNVTRCLRYNGTFFRNNRKHRECWRHHFSQDFHPCSSATRRTVWIRHFSFWLSFVSKEKCHQAFKKRLFDRAASINAVFRKRRSLFVFEGVLQSSQFLVEREYVELRRGAKREHSLRNKSKKSLLSF